jgi:hypothetical protein
LSGKSTLAEADQPYGFGKIAKIDFTHPLQAPANIASGVRDLAAGRPWWSGKPTDVNLREAFRTGGPKPDFRAPASAMPWEQPPKQLSANVPGNAGYGDVDPGSMVGLPHPGPSVTPAPLERLQLPASTGAGEAQPMVRYAKPYVEPYDPHLRPLDVEDYQRFAPKKKE